MNITDKADLTAKVRNALRNEGFDFIGIVEALPHPEDSLHIKEWIGRGSHGTMHFMERNLQKRADITKIVPGARSVIVAAIRYYSRTDSDARDSFFISRYARVRDYHRVIKDKLTRVHNLITTEAPNVTGKVFCDSNSLNEKTWAIRAGLGWRGRNSIVISREFGSFLFLGEILTSAELVYDNHVSADHCGSCRKCIEACPTGAICEDRTINAPRCIAYLTIEHEGDLPEEMLGKTENIIFGCDRCQEVCPWNRKLLPYNDSELVPEYDIAGLDRSSWMNMTEAEFRIIFRSTPVIRTGFEKIKRNILFAEKGLSEKR